MGRRGDRRRSHGTRRGGGCGHARLQRRAFRTGGFRQRDIEPEYQTGARRGTLPGAGRRGAGVRSPARTRPVAAERAASGRKRRFYHPVLPLVGKAVLYDRPDRLRPDGGTAGAGQIAAEKEIDRTETDSDSETGWAAGRGVVPRRAVRRRTAGGESGADRDGRRRHGDELRPGYRLAQRGRRYGERRAGRRPVHGQDL